MTQRWLKKLRGLMGSESDDPSAEIPPPIVVPDVKIESPTRPSASASPTPDPSGVDAVFLRQQISNHVSLDQLRELAEQMGLDSAEFSGGKGRQVLQLVEAAQAAEALPHLLALCQTLDPSVNWQLDAPGSE